MCHSGLNRRHKKKIDLLKTFVADRYIKIGRLGTEKIVLKALLETKLKDIKFCTEHATQRIDWQDNPIVVLI